jgi:hypothetical protein
VLTVFIGGNHEASNYLWELYHGGWVAPNIYYLGAAGVVNVGGLRVAGLSGIYKREHYDWGVPLGRHGGAHHTAHAQIISDGQLRGHLMRDRMGRSGNKIPSHALTKAACI